MTWKPHVAVAAIIERDKKFLMVEEFAHGKCYPLELLINLPS